VRAVTEHDHHGPRPSTPHVRNPCPRDRRLLTRFLLARLLDGEPDEVGETFERDRIWVADRPRRILSRSGAEIRLDESAGQVRPLKPGPRQLRPVKLSAGQTHLPKQGTGRAPSISRTKAFLPPSAARSPIHWPPEAMILTSSVLIAGS
jgi:hypothetical protein